MTFSKFGRSDEFSEWSRRIHDLMDEMSRRSFVHYRPEATWEPATDVYETREAYYVCFELAGMDPDGVEVECLDPQRVRIGGYRSNPRPAEVTGPLSVHVMEINHGPFRREVHLPEPVRVDEVDATYDKGCLWVRLPKMDQTT
jgi:HSP20 family protein